MNKKQFNIFKNETNLNWVNNNLDVRDYIINEIYITIYYNYDWQKNDILNALKLYLHEIYNQIHDTNY